MGTILSELRRRNVFRVAAAYLVVGWIVLQVVSVVGDAARLPDWTDSFALVVLLTAFPVILFIAWAFELTPEGLKRTVDVAPEDSISHKTGRLFDFVIVAALVVVAGLIGWQLLASKTGTPDMPQIAGTDSALDSSMVQPAAASAAPANATMAGVEPDAKSIAVLPFLAFSNDEEDGYFADGLTEEILNSLAYLPDLLVTSRTSAFQFRGEDLPSVPEIAAQLGVAHILEGSVRRSNDQVRVTVQLIRASDDAHLWSQTYDRSLDNVFAIQEDIAENVARVLEVVLDDTARERMADTGTRNVEAYVAFQRGWNIWTELHEIDEQHRLDEASVHFAEATRLDPGYSDAFLLQSDTFAHVMTDLVEAPDFDEVAFEAAHAEHRRLLDLAERASRDPVRRATARVNRLLFSENWTGAAQDLATAMDPQSCAADNYLNTLAEFLQPSDQIVEYYRSQVRCDPLNATAWGALYSAAAQMGYFDEAESALLRREDLRGDDNQSLTFFEIERLIAAGDTDAAETLFNEMQVPGPNRAYLELRFASMRGDSEAAATAADTLLSIPDLPLRFQVLIHALVGNRDEANALVAQVDERPLSPIQLRQIINICSCGAPFDLEAAPNFAARITEAGFPWPPEPDYGFALMQE
ncbi:hypothetical protein [Hyphobacterium marinum]|uniref:Integral membrane protein n=1 Tax=Hyphobacterium marinum TaxID=3116574 RepID=A0ABU7M0A0_9PROT|nr:hypothetical protein [Hyphobacterium sp. Y6023]MEE2567219.1 hypothetical protein [Hyphobacterium sp. Y6023]